MLANKSKSNTMFFILVLTLALFLGNVLAMPASNKAGAFCPAPEVKVTVPNVQEEPDIPKGSKKDPAAISNPHKNNRRLENPDVPYATPLEALSSQDVPQDVQNSGLIICNEILNLQTVDPYWGGRIDSSHSESLEQTLTDLAPAFVDVVRPYPSPMLPWPAGPWKQRIFRPLVSGQTKPSYLLHLT